MNAYRIWKLSLIAPLLLALAWLGAQPAVADEGDPPSRVGRISYLGGTVSFEPANANDWTNASLNRPMTVGDRIWVDADSKAEIEVGGATLHLGDKTGVSFLNLDDKTIQVRLSEGALGLRVRELKDGDIYEVDTPNAAFTVTKAGAFRFDVNEAGDYTGITALQGAGDATTGGHTYPVHPGERAEFRGQEDNVEYHTVKAAQPDKLDQWANERNTRDEQSESAKYVSRDVPGYEDLDNNGQWRDEPDYGPMWYPSNVPAGWAPYGFGHWVWIDPWGWTWVDDEPWGFAPFHYGRWAFVGGYWGWCPGPIFARPFFGPAFVGFVGGRHWGFGFGFGSPIGWFPLGFGEVYHPWFRASRNFITNINVRSTRIANVNSIHANVNGMHFANMRVPGAVTAVSRNTFVNSQSVRGAAFHPSASQLSSARVESRIDASPTMRSRMGGQVSGTVRVPPASVQNRAVVSRATPSASAHTVTRPAMGTMRSGSQMAGRVERPGTQATGNSGAFSSRRAAELQQSRPPSAARVGGANQARGASPANRPNESFNRGASQPAARATVNSRPTPSASNRATSGNRSDRPPQSYNNNRAAPQSPRSYSSERPTYSGRSYSAPPRSYSTPSRSYGSSPRSYSAPRYSAPSRSYSTPAQRSYSTPRSHSGGGGRSSSSGGSRSSGSSSGGSGGSSRGRR